MSGSELFPIVIGETGKAPAKAIGGTLADVWQGIIGDRVAAWRIRNAAKISEALGREIAKTGQSLNLDKIPEGVAFAWFEKATLSDEPEIQEMFAKLLANAAAGNADAIKKRNIELVSQLTPDDATLLEVIAKRYRTYLAVRWAGDKYSFAMKVAWDFHLRLREEGFEDVTSIDALQSLGILRLENQTEVDPTILQSLFELSSHGDLTLNLYPSADNMLKTTSFLGLTRVGVSLVDALFPQPDDDAS